MDARESDETLMLRYRDGDAAAFDALYIRHRGALYRFIKRSAPGSGEVDEIFQDVWMRLIEARARYQPTARFTTWLFTLAHHRLVDNFRAAVRAPRASASHDDDDEDPVAQLPASRLAEPEVLAIARQQGARLVQLVEALPDAQRETLLMKLEGDLSIEDIAAATGVNFETAKSRLRYALARVRAGLAQAGFAPQASAAGEVS